MVAVACSFFAAQDDPAPAIFRFLRGTVATVIVDGVYLFTMLVVAVAPAFLHFGWLTARPATGSLGVTLGANGATFLALQSTYSADFASFADGGAAAVIGMSAAAVVTRLLRSVAADWSGRRLVRANWVTLAASADRRGRGDRAGLRRPHREPVRRRQRGAGVQHEQAVCRPAHRAQHRRPTGARAARRRPTSQRFSTPGSPRSRADG